MAETPPLDPLDANRAQQEEDAVRFHALEQLFAAFAPGTLPAPVAYRVLLERVRMLLDAELAHTATAPATTAPTAEPPEEETDQAE